MTKSAPSGDKRTANSYPIRAVERVCDILDVLQRSRSGISLPGIADATELPKSSAFRYLAALEARHYVQRDDATATYKLGVAFQPVHTQHLETLVTVAREPLGRLRDTTGETANLGWLDGAAVVHAAVVDSEQMMRLAARVGERGPVHSTAMGKAMAARLGDDEVRAILASTTLESLTARTIVDADEFVEALERVRRDGYALDDLENQLDGRCVAVAIGSLPFPAAVSVSAPAGRLDLDDVPEVAKALRRAARDIERGLEGRVPVGSVGFPIGDS